MNWFFLLAVRRLRARWRSLLTLIIGVLLAALIGANASLYTTAIAQVGMVQYLSQQPADDINLYSRTSIAPVDVEDFAVAWSEDDVLFAEVFNQTSADFTEWTGSVILWAETQDLYVRFNGEDIPDATVRLAYYEQLENYAELVDGSWAADNPVDSDVEVVIAEPYAEQLGLAVGGVLELDQRGWESSRIFTARISGIIREANPLDPYWFNPSPLRNNSNSGIDINLLTTRASLERIPPEFLPQPQVQIGWRVAFNHNGLPFTQLKAAADRIAMLETELNREFLGDEAAQGNLVFTTNLPALLSDYSQDIVFLNIPFGLLLVQLGALVLFFLVLIAALVRRGERREIALLQSRGAEDSQIIVLRMLEALIICGAATLIAPFVARQILAWFIPIFTGIDRIPLELNVNVFLYAGGASALALLLLTTTLLPVLNQPLITAGGAGSRSSAQTWWQKYYLDVVLLIVGMVALFQLTRSQSIVLESASGNTQADPLLLLAPTLLFVAFSSVLLRFFPGMMNIVANFFARRRGAEFALATWQVSREPLHYGRIAFLLALAIGIGWFAISYQGTLIGNQNDQSTYLVGSNVRIVYADPTLPETQLSMERIANLPEVESVAQVTRIELPNISTGGGRRSRQEGELLAVEPMSLQNVTEWRSDLGSLVLPETNMTIPTAGRELPADTSSVRLSALMEGQWFVNFGEYTEEHRIDPRPLQFEHALSLLLRDSAGNRYSVRLIPDTAELEAFIEAQGEAAFLPIDTDDDGSADAYPELSFPDDGWLTFEADLSTLSPAPQGALSITHLNVLIPDVFQVIVPRLTVSDFQAVTSDGTVSQLGWTNTAEWDVVRAQNSLGPTEYALVETVPQEFGGSGLQLGWNALSASNDMTAFSLLLDFPERATVSLSERRNQGNSAEAEEPDETAIVGIPVLVSRSFAELNEFTEGQRFTLVVNNVTPWFEARRIVGYYPTLYQERPYIVVDAAYLNYALDRATGVVIEPNELWIKLRSGVDETAFVEQLRQSEDSGLFEDIISMEAVRSGYETDVLALGVIGLLFFSFMVGLALSVVSLFTYISLTVQARMGEFAVLRALGMTNSRMVLSIVAEQLFVLLSAITLGAVIGQFLTLQVLPPLALSAAGGSVTPPFVVVVDFAMIARYLLAIVVILAIVLALSSLWVRHAATAEALRLEED